MDMQPAETLTVEAIAYHAIEGDAWPYMRGEVRGDVHDGLPAEPL